MLDFIVFFFANSMSGQAVNRNVCVKHIPVVVNAIKKLEQQIQNNNTIKEFPFELTFSSDPYYCTPFLRINGEDAVTNKVGPLYSKNTFPNDFIIEGQEVPFSTKFDKKTVMPIQLYHTDFVSNVTDEILDPIATNTEINGETKTVTTYVQFSTEIRLNADNLSESTSNKLWNILTNNEIISLIAQQTKNPVDKDGNPLTPINVRVEMYPSWNHPEEFHFNFGPNNGSTISSACDHLTIFSPSRSSTVRVAIYGNSVRLNNDTLTSGMLFNPYGQTVTMTLRYR